MGGDRQFSLDLKRFAQKLQIDLATARKRAALDIFTRVTKKSPVGNPDLWKSTYKPKDYVGGRFRASWTLTDSTPSSRAEGEGKNSYPGSGSILARFGDAYDVSWVVNNLPYAGALEGPPGHSSQAPEGVAMVSVMEVEQEINSRLIKL
jgi:hypothetical protein